jgi:methionyl-tRNA synthetase
MLLSAGVPLPTTIFVHSYITLGGGKVSKSLGNVVDPVELAETYGTDALRYYLLREISPFEDGDFTLERFIRSYNADLADQLGNLLNRVVSMVGRYYGGVVPTSGDRAEEDERLIGVAQALPERISKALSRYDPQSALAAIWELVGAANSYVESTAPWSLAKARKAEKAEKAEGAEGPAEQRLATVLYNLVEALRVIAWHVRPFLPATAEGIDTQLGLQEVEGPADATVWGAYPAGTRLIGGTVLFPKFELPEAPAVQES